jgi:hypothetical protein
LEPLVTESTRVAVKPPADAVIVAVPAATPVTTPVDGPTVATAVLLDAHVKVAGTTPPVALYAAAESATVEPTLPVMATEAMAWLVPPGPPVSPYGEVAAPPPDPPPHDTSAALANATRPERIRGDGIFRITPLYPPPASCVTPPRR